MSGVHSEHLIPPSSRVPSFLHSSEHRYIWGGNADEVSHWGGSEDETPPARSLALSLYSPIIDLQKPQTRAFLSARALIFPSRILVCPSLTPGPSVLPPHSLFPCLPAPPPTINAISFRWRNKWNSSCEHGSRRWTQAASLLPSCCISSSHTRHTGGAFNTGGTWWPSAHLDNSAVFVLAHLKRNNASHVLCDWFYIVFTCVHITVSGGHFVYGNLILERCIMPSWRSLRLSGGKGGRRNALYQFI